MKLSNLIFISRANLKASKRKKSVLVMMIISVIAIIVLAGYLSKVNLSFTSKLNSSSFCQIEIAPEVVYPETSHKGVNDKNKVEILEVEHVLSCEPKNYPDYQFFEYLEIKDENGNDLLKSGSGIDEMSLEKGLSEFRIDDELAIKSAKGDNLQDSPTMSCIIPDKTYIVDYETNKFNEFDTSWLNGKTITVKCNYHATVYNNPGEDDVQQDGYVGEDVELAELMFDLKVAGIYSMAEYSSVTGSGTVIISPKTAKEIDDMAVAEAEKTMPEVIKSYTDDPYARPYIVTVDNRENTQAVADKLFEMGYVAAVVGIIDPSYEQFATFFLGGGTFLLIAIILLTVIDLFLSVYSNVNERRGEIGLMKAVGYKTPQIFWSMYIENVIQAIKAIITGGVVSAFAITIINILNINSGEFTRLILNISPGYFCVLAVVALLLILIIPLICLLIMTALIAKIPPQEAMNS